MSETGKLDKTFHIIMKRMVETGQAPHYTEIAKELGVSMEEGRKALHDLFSARIHGFLFPNTDFIASFAPFNNLPTQFRITIEGQQKWFAQWAFESLAVCWLFPGKTVRVDTPCPDCGEPIRVDIRDGVILKAEPEGLIGYVAVPFGSWRKDMGYAWSTMTFFRSEEHLRNWPRFDPATEEGIIPLHDLTRLFSGKTFRKRLDPDYFSHMREYGADFMTTLQEIGKTGPFWSLKRR
jgi:hypothetical protein